MKLSPRSYSILWDAHAVVGVIASIVLFPIFFLGTFALFAEDLVPWQEPAFRTPIAVSDDAALEIIQDIVDREAEVRPMWFGISLPTEEEPFIRTWRMDGGGVVSTWLDPVTGGTLGERSDLGEFLNQLHFLDPIPGGIYVAGIASVILTLLIGTGLLIQLGKMARELVQFRPDRNFRVLWSDAHKVIGVVTSPFLLVFALTGTVLCLEGWLDPSALRVIFDGDRQAFAEATDWPAPPSPSGVRAQAPRVNEALATATAMFPDSELRWFFFDELGDENAVIHLPGEKEGDLHPFSHVRMSREGEVLWSKEGGGSTHYSRIVETFYGLHFAAWADTSVKLVYGLLSWLVAFSILAGNLLWLERRKAKGHGAFDRVLQRLTVGACAGLPFAVAVLFVANQLIPLDVADRMGLEHLAFFLAWGVALVVALATSQSGRLAAGLLSLAGGLFFLVPAIDWLRTSRLPFGADSPLVTATEVGLLAVGALLLWAALVVHRLVKPVAGAEAPAAALSP